MVIKRNNLREIEYTPGPGVESKKGWFHKWSDEPFDNERSGYVSKTYGIIEMEDGTVKTVEPRMIKFKDQYAY